MAISGGDGSIILNTKVDTSGINSGLNSIKSSIAKIGSALGIAFGVSALVQFGKQAMNLASDLQEVQNVVDVAFGNMTYKMEQFADTAIETYGISKLTAKQIGSTFMSMAVGMGVAEDAAADMSLTLTGLAADVASFRNVSVEEARTALASVFTGETETLKRYGVMLQEVNLQEYAREHGITKSINAMTQQEKLMLRYNYVLDALSLAQGDFARTQDSFANKTRVLTEKWKEMQSVFGETLIILADGLMPVLEVVIQKLTIFALYLAAFAKGMTSAGEETEKLSQNTEDYGQNANKSANQTNRATGAIKKLGSETKKTNKQLAQFDELMVLQSAGSNAMDETGFGGIGDIFPAGFSENMSALNEFLDGDTLQNIQEFQTWVSENKGAIKTALEVAGILALAGSVTSLLKKLGLLPGAFKKKDDGLDTQTPKVQTETVAVNALSGAFSLAALAILSKFVPALGELFGKQEETSGATATATENVSQFGSQMGFAAQSADSYSASVEGAGQKTSQFGNVVSSASQQATASTSQFATTSSGNMAGWSTSVEESAKKGFGSIAGGAYQATESAQTNVEKMIENTGSGMTEWANETTETVSIKFEEMANNIRLALLNAWTNIKTFLKGAFTDTQETDPFERFNRQAKARAYWNTFVDGWKRLIPFAGMFAGGFAIPAFARGAVLPGGKPFLGILNDQPAGQTNIEAPLQTIVDAFNIALQGNANYGGGNTEVVLEIDGREFGRAVVEQGNRENRRIGTRLVIA